MSMDGTIEGCRARLPADVIDTYSKVGFAKLYTRKTPLTAADILNGWVSTKSKLVMRSR